MSLTTTPSERRATIDPAPPKRPVASSGGSGPRDEPPLLQMQAHWSVPAHRSYLHAATFHWQR